MMLNKWCLNCCFLKWHQTVWIRPFLLINCSMNNDVQVQLLITNWTEASGNTQYHIKRIHRLNYTEHSRKTFGNQLVMFLLACMFNVWTFKTVLLPCILHILRYYLQIKSNHFYCHITTAQVPWWVKFLRACSKQCKKQKQFTYRQYIFTDCTEDNVQNTHTHTQYTQCTIKTVLVTNTLCTHFTLCTHLNIVVC